MSQYKEDLDKMKWSFSRVKSYIQCPYQFYLKYIVKDEEVGNYYAFMGKLMHECLEQILKKNITVDEAIKKLEQEHAETSNDFRIKKKIKEKSLELCMDYLCLLELNELDKFNILGVELEIRLEIEGYEYVGYIDLLLEEKETGDIIIIDHKSSAYPFKKDGKQVLKSHTMEFEYYKKQMYLYCYGVYQRYHKYPKKIMWNHFKSRKYAVINFNEEEYLDTIKWFIDTIHTIEKDKHFLANTEFFYCVNLCGFRDDCEYRGDL